MSVDTKSFGYLPRLSSKNCDMQFANNDRQISVDCTAEICPRLFYSCQLIVNMRLYVFMFCKSPFLFYLLGFVLTSLLFVLGALRDATGSWTASLLLCGCIDAAVAIALLFLRLRKRTMSSALDLPLQS